LLPEIARKKLALIRARREEKTGVGILPGTFEGFLRERLNLDKVNPAVPDRPVLFPAQWVLVKVVFDGRDPIDLETEEEHDLALGMFGPCERISPTARHTVAMLKGARIGGTWLWSLWLLYRALTCDLSGLGFGESAFGPIVAERLELGYQSINYIKGALKEADLDHLRVNDAIESVRLQRPDGHVATIQAFAASRGGAATRSRTYFGALLDEACFFRAAGNGIVNDLEIHRSVAARATIKGSLVGVVSTAWAEEGLLWDLVNKNLGPPGGELHGRQESALACITPTELMRQDDTIKAVIRIARDTDPENAAREFDCVPLSQNTTTFFDAASITRAISRAKELGLVMGTPPEEFDTVGAGVDTGLISDSSACVIVHRKPDKIYRLSVADEQKPEKDKPLKLSEVCKRYAGLIKAHFKRSAFADGHTIEPSREHIEKDGCSLDEAPAGAQGKLETHSFLRELLNDDKMAIPQQAEKLISQLREVVSKPLPGGGLKIWSPRNKGGHGDIASALVLAVWDASQSGTAPAAVLPTKPQTRWANRARQRGF
jgi:hypothetical protein